MRCSVLESAPRVNSNFALISPVDDMCRLARTTRLRFLMFKTIPGLNFGAGIISGWRSMRFSALVNLFVAIGCGVIRPNGFEYVGATIVRMQVCVALLRLI